MPLKRLFKTAHLEKINRQRGSKIEIIWQEKWIFGLKTTSLLPYNYAFDGQFTCTYCVRACRLPFKSNGFVRKTHGALGVIVGENTQQADY